MKKLKKNVKGAIALFSVIMILTASSLYWITPVKAQVFSVDIPNVMDLGILKPMIVGEYEVHLTDFKISGFFNIGDDTVFYNVSVGKADVRYSFEMDESFNLSASYFFDYEDFNFDVNSDSFSISVVYSEHSAKGNLEISLLGDNTLNLAVYEWVPRYAVTASKWTPLEINVAREVQPS